ncbi:FAD-dependent oxidoreductase [Ruegeria sp. 2012CJ41-6]|uniref:FAD-dependent oxidoreductase n=1 Tax=Ruegeria spongiae TaxID=2942209 RepID=A0ABT0Q7Y8_9RHOB|nr:FAD-dependent oxidoreductase [Ruegeria spongiae]MCL6285989.1 FAD-dependent oxidoreductase [Ruegeria spongiae]
MGLGRKKKLVVLGGGMGTLSAIYAITSKDRWRADFESITVYEETWRLGGKGASGRNPDACFRSEEHGLHIWLGFYDNALELIQDCYKKLDPSHGHRWQDWTQAFTPLDAVQLLEKGFGGRPTEYKFPPRGGQASLGAIPSILGAARLLSTSGTTTFSQDFQEEFATKAGPSIGARITRIDQHTADLERKGELHREQWKELRDDLDYTLWEFNRREQQLLRGKSADVFQMWVLMNLSLSLLFGIVRDRIYARGFEVIERLEWSRWMHRNRATRRVLASAPVRACYDLIFGYVNGWANARCVGAGTGTYCLLRMVFGYRNHFAYQLNAGMGEVVFSPLYHVLRDRGVEFKFFHKVTNILPDRTGTAVDSIQLQCIRRVKGDREYLPLFNVKNLQCWPTQPFEDQLEPLPKTCAEDRVSLQYGDDFHDVILGIPPPALDQITEELQAVNAQWRDMTDKLRTTATLSAHLWMTASTTSLGWPDQSTLFGAYEKPLDTIWDADSLIEFEDFPADNCPKAIMYLCGVMADGEDPRTTAKEWIKTRADGAWSNVRNPTKPEFDWRMLYDPQDRPDEKRLDWQAIHINDEGAARYVQSRPGTARYRLRSDQSGLENLWLAGDWTKTALNAGCMEAAIMSGQRAARGVSGYSEISVIGEADRPILPTGPLDAIRQVFDGLDDAIGEIDALGAVLALPNADVTTMLPDNLEIVPHPNSPSGLHPVGVLFAHHWNVRPARAPEWLGRGYNEVAIAVPFVRPRHSNDAQLFTYLPILLLDSPGFTALGALGFGLNKKICSVTNGGGYRQAQTVFRQVPLLTFDTRAAGQARPASEFPNLDLARDIFSLPVLTRHFGNWRRLNMAFDFAAAWVTPVAGQLSVENVFLDGFRRQQVQLANINHDPFSAFAFRCGWSLT